MTPTPKLTAKGQVEQMLARGWLWRDPISSVLVHPHDYNLFVVYDPEAGTLRYSAALLTAMELIIPTPSTQNPRYWPDEKRANPRKKTAG